MVDVSSFKEIYRERFGIKYERKWPSRPMTSTNPSRSSITIFRLFNPRPPMKRKAVRKRPGFPAIYLDLARTLAQRSTCYRRKLGPSSRVPIFVVLAIGYNGNATGLHNGCDREEPGNCGCLHSRKTRSSTATHRFIEIRVRYPSALCSLRQAAHQPR